MVLSGCLAGNGVGLLPSGPSDAALVHRKSVAQGQVNVVGPKNYCIATDLVRDGAKGAFVPLAPCAAMARGTKSTMPDPRFFLSAVVQPLNADVTLTEEGLVPAARTALDAGVMRAAFGAKAEILTYRGEGQALVAQTRVGKPAPGLDATQWRAIFLRNGHVLALSVSGFEGEVSEEAGQKAGEAVLLQFLSTMQAANPTNGPKVKAPTVLPKFLRRLLN